VKTLKRYAGSVRSAKNRMSRHGLIRTANHHGNLNWSRKNQKNLERYWERTRESYVYVAQLKSRLCGYILGRKHVHH
jgi:hypothetical protein